MTLLMLVLMAALSLAAASQESSTPQVPEQPVVDPQAEAYQAVLRAGGPQQQLALAEQFVRDYPGSPYLSHIYLAAGSAHRMQGHFDQAVEYGERALELNPRDVISLLLIADSLSEGARKDDPGYEDMLTRAQDYSQQALDILPEYFGAIQRRPDVPEEHYKMREQYFEAQARATLGYVYLRRKQFAEAENQLRQATELNHFQPSAADFERLGVVQVEQNKLEEARRSFLRCAEVGGAAFSTCQKRVEIVDEMMKKQGGIQPQE